MKIPYVTSLAWFFFHDGQPCLFIFSEKPPLIVALNWRKKNREDGGRKKRKKKVCTRIKKRSIGATSCYKCFILGHPNHRCNLRHLILITILIIKVIIILVIIIAIVISHPKHIRTYTKIRNAWSVVAVVSRDHPCFPLLWKRPSASLRPMSGSHASSSLRAFVISVVGWHSSTVNPPYHCGGQS